MQKIVMAKEDDVPKKCRNCDLAKKMTIGRDYLCAINGIVSPDYLCKKYQITRDVVTPPKKRFLNTQNLKAEDFDIG